VNIGQQSLLFFNISWRFSCFIDPDAEFLKEQLDDHSAARGLQLISQGFPLVTKNDGETAERARFGRAPSAMRTPISRVR
jgi:hypothetical protein